MTSRLPVYALDPAGATDGQRVTYDAATGRVIWADDGSSSGGIAVEDEGVQIVAAATRLNFTGAGVTVTDAGAGEATVDIPGGGGSGGSGGVILLENTGSVPAGTAVGTIVFRKAPSSTLWDFRGASALPAGWTRRGVASETFSASGLTASLAAGQGYQYAHPDANTDYTLEAKIVTASFTSKMMGVMANLTSGAGTAAFPYDAPSGVLVGTVNTSWQYGGAFTNAGGTPAYPMRVRLRKAGSTFYASMSTDDGASWTTEGSITNSGTYTNIGFGSILGAATTMTVEWIRFTPSNSGSSSGLRGWWDGTTIVTF